MTPIQVAFRNIVDVISCADGGIAFCRFKFFVEDLENQAKRGDIAAGQLCDLVMHFSKLINIAQMSKEKPK